MQIIKSVKQHRNIEIERKLIKKESAENENVVNTV